MQVNKTQVQIQGLWDSVAQKDASAKSAARPDPDVKIDVSSTEYVNQALDTNDADVVEQAKKLLASGALDTPEAARKAAENLLKFGI